MYLHGYRLWCRLHIMCLFTCDELAVKKKNKKPLMLKFHDSNA